MKIIDQSRYVDPVERKAILQRQTRLLCIITTLFPTLDMYKLLLSISIHD